MGACENYTVTEARQKFSEVLDTALFKGPVVIKRRNSAVAVISYDLLTALTELEAKSDAKLAEAALREYEAKGGYTLKEIKDELGID
jgi:prevent-host-death family protein